VVPYLNFECFYDTRYDDWARTLATLGAEVTATDRFVNCQSLTGYHRLRDERTGGCRPLEANDVRAQTVSEQISPRS
jgi:hypothetical protein